HSDRVLSQRQESYCLPNFRKGGSCAGGGQRSAGRSELDPKTEMPWGPGRTRRRTFRGFPFLATRTPDLYLRELHKSVPSCKERRKDALTIRLADRGSSPLRPSFLIAHRQLRDPP